MRYLHTMVRITDIDQSLDFYCTKFGLVETRRIDSENGRYDPCHGLLDNAEAGPPAARPRRRLSALTQRVPLGPLPRTLALADRVLGPLTGAAGFVLWLALVGTAIALLRGSGPPSRPTWRASSASRPPSCCSPPG